MSDGWTKIKRAAQYAGIGDRTMREWLKAGLRHSRLPTGTILVRFSDIDEFLESFAVNEDRVDRAVDEIMKGIQS